MSQGGMEAGVTMSRDGPNLAWRLKTGTRNLLAFYKIGSSGEY